MLSEVEYERLKQFYIEVEQSLTLSDYEYLLEENGFHIKSKHGKQWFISSACHNVDSNNCKANLRFYTETKTFYCYSGCNCAYTIYTLLKQRFDLIGNPKRSIQVLKYICNYKNIPFNFNGEQDIKKRDVYNWQNDIGKYLRNTSNYKENVPYDKFVLSTLSDIYYQGWIDEGISIEIQQKYNIKFYKRNQQIVIPIYDDIGNFVATHCRNLNPILVEQGLKYFHLQMLDGTEYKFNCMSNILFGLNLNKLNIQTTKEVILFESPKSVMMYDGFVELNNSVALFSMILQNGKRDLLIKYNVEHVIIALDRQYESMYNEYGSKTKDFEQYEKRVFKIVDTIKPYVNKISIIYDND
ncbi:MAG: hypothetical protein RSC65_03875, partial [Malacoplasma sp.]